LRLVPVVHIASRAGSSHCASCR